MGSAGALGNMEESIIEPLKTALENEDLETIAETYCYFLYKIYFISEEEDILIKALNKYGTRTIAEEFLNSESEQLEKAAEVWAEEHGYYIDITFY